MRRYIDSSSKTNEIRLLLKHPTYKNSLVIILEGSTDIRLFRSLLYSDSVCLESVDGKVDLINVMNDLKEDRNISVIAICDADFDHINNLADERAKSGIYLTDVHDAETMLVNSPSLTSFIDEYSNHDNHAEINGQLKDCVLSVAYEIGLIRLTSFNDKMNLNMKKMNYNNFININKLNVDLNKEQFISDILIRSKSLKSGVDKDLILSRYEEEKQLEHSLLQVCCGHDIANIVAMLYSQRWVSCVQNINKDKVESALRLAYTIEYFKNTSLYTKIINAIGEYGFEINDANNCIQRTT